MRYLNFKDKIKRPTKTEYQFYSFLFLRKNGSTIKYSNKSRKGFGWLS